MATAQEILAELQPLGNEGLKRMLMKNHDVKEPCFGVKIGDMQPIRKRMKKDYQLALDLYATSHVKPLTALAIQTGEDIGRVTADLGDNDCEFFHAPDYIRKVKARGTIGKKRKTVKC